MAGRFGARAYTDLDRMLAEEELDVVNVCTPSGMHGQQACRIMRSGRHVVVEKPMEISLDRINEMLRVQEETGVKMTVISQHRWDPASLYIHRLMEEGAFGRLVLGNAVVPWWRTQEYYDSGGWRGTWQLDGGGILMNQSIHYIDILQWLMGPVRSVYAHAETLAHRIETEDTAAAVLRFTNGALGTIAATTGAYPGRGARVEVHGDGGTAVVEDGELAYLHLAQNDAEEVGDYGLGSSRGNQAGTVELPAPEASAHALQIADFIRAIREDGTPLIDGYAARHPVQIILAVYESSQTHREVVLP
jgi:predicted dehydrogenase